MTTESVTGKQVGTEQAQVTDPAKSQFGVAQVSSIPSGALTKEDVAKEIRRAETRIGMEWRKRLDEAELKAIGDDPEGARLLSIAQEARRREDEANQKLADAADAEARALSALSRAERLEANATARELSVKYSVDPSLLLQFTEGRVEKMEDLAKLLPKVTPGQPPANTTTTTNPSYRPDSGLTLGGGNLSLDSLVKTDTRNMNPAQLREHKRLIEAQARGLPR